MTNNYSKEDVVCWNWGEGTAEGTIQEVYNKTVTMTIKGSEVTRKGTKDMPAYLIKQNDGDIVLKLHSEIKKV
jgi:hypothetical protein